jgi:sec-independent protein translocase protein TatA
VAAAGVGGGAVPFAHSQVDLTPPVELRVGRGPHEGAVVAVAGGHGPTGAGEAPHGGQRADGVAEMLEDLVGVDDVEGLLGKLEGPEIAGLQRHVANLFGGGVTRLGHDGVRHIDPDDLAVGCHPPGEVDGQRAGTATDVEEAEPIPQMGQQVGGRVVSRAPPCERRTQSERPWMYGSLTLVIVADPRPPLRFDPGPGDSISAFEGTLFKSGQPRLVQRTRIVMGALELIVLLAIILLIFGATRIPKLARSVGKAPDEFKAGLHEPPDGRGPDPS